MTAPLRRRAMTEAEFLTWAEPLEKRWEYDGTGPVAMPDETIRHGLIQTNLLVVLANRLRGLGRHVFGSQIFMRAGSSLRLPDAMIICRDIQRQNRVIVDPVVIFEVLSVETEHLDRSTKLNEYCSIPSLRYYVMVQEADPVVAALARAEVGWTRNTVQAGEDLVLPELHLAVPVAAFYEDMNFPNHHRTNLSTPDTGRWINPNTLSDSLPENLWTTIEA